MDENALAPSSGIIEVHILDMEQLMVVPRLR